MKKIVFLFVLLLFSAFCFSQQHKISVTAGNGGSIKVSINGNVVSPDPNKYDGSVPVNTNVSILAIPSSGYEFIKWSNGSATNPMDIVITEEKNLSAEFKKKDDDNKGDKYTITVNPCKNRNVTPDVDLIQKVDKDKVVNFTIKPNQGYELEAFKVGGKDVKSNINNNNYSHTVISDVTIDVSFKPTEQDKLTVEIVSVEHGKVTTKNDLKQLKKGDKIEFEIEPEDGYEIESFKLNDIEHKDDIKDGKFALAVDKNYSVSASFKQIGTENTVIIDIADSSKFYVRRFKDSVKIVDSVYLNLDFLKLPNDTVFLIKANDTILYSLFSDSLCIYIKNKSDSVPFYFSDNVYAGVLDSLLHKLNVERSDNLTLFNSSQTLKSEASFSDLKVFPYMEDVPSELLPIWVWILIGVVVLAVVIFVILWFFVLKRRKEKDSKTGSDGNEQNDESTKGKIKDTDNSTQNSNGKTGSNDTTEGAKSPVDGAETTTEDTQSPTDGSKPATEGAQSPTDDSKPATEDAQSAVDGSKTTTEGAQSPVDGSKPATEDTKSSADGSSNSTGKPNSESDEISKLKKEIDKLKEDLNNQKQNEEARVKNKVDDVEKGYKKKMEDYENLKSKYNADIKKAKEDAETKIKNDYESKRKKLEKEKDDDKNKAERKLADLKEEKEKVERKLKTVKEDCESSFKKERQSLTDEKEKAEKQFKQKKQEFEAASAELTRTKNNLTEAKEKIQHLEVSQKRYADTISVIPSSLGAAGYATNIINLLNVYNSIQRKAVEMQDIKVEDKYPLYKANAIFEKNISVIDMSGFYADAEMVSRGELIFKNRSVISNAKNMSDVKFYFYTTYLEKFISALAIYNESLAGLYGWGYSKNDTSAFNDFRQKIESVAKSLGIKIEIPKLFDNADIVYDVYLVDGCEFDGQFSKGQILEIETCLVYLDGGNRPSARIKVKAQE